LKIYDEERFLEDVSALLIAGLPAKIIEINDDKDDGIVLENIPADRFIENLDDSILNFEKFVFQGISGISAIGMRGATALDVELFFDIIFVDDQGANSKTVRKKIQRYTRAMREIINKDFRKLECVSDLTVGSMSPTNLSNPEGNVFYKVAGIQVKGTIG